MLTLRYGQVKAACSKAAHLAQSDPRLADYVNEAVERLLHEGHWVGTTQAYRICVLSSCITWPRQIESIESFAISNCPGTVRNEWYEFLDSGPGILSASTSSSGGCCGTSSSCGSQLIDRGEACAFDDVAGTGKKIAVYADKQEESGSKIILQYYDSVGQFVRTMGDDEWINGESITIPNKGKYAYTTFEVANGGLIRVIKPVTNGVIRLYEYNVATTALKPLAYYDPDETDPVYRRSIVPGLTSTSTNGTCSTTSIDVMAKLRFIPVSKDNDYLLISHPGAVKLAVKAIRDEEAERWAEAQVAWSAAKQCLDKQLGHHIGSGAVQPIRMQSSSVWGAGVANVI